MSYVKVGDRIKNVGGIQNTRGGNYGKLGTVVHVSGDMVHVKYDDGCLGNEDTPNYYQKISKSMSLKDKIVAAFLSEPEKSFRRKGITNGDGFLTAEGTEVFLGYLLKKHGAEFKKEVVDQIEEDKE